MRDDAVTSGHLVSPVAVSPAPAYHDRPRREDHDGDTRVTRVRSDDRSRRREFDAIYIGTKGVLLNETKSPPITGDVQSFANFLSSGEFALYFPEYRDLPVVPVFSALSLPADMVTNLTRHGIYALAMGDYAMQVVNLDAVRNRSAT